MTGSGGYPALRATGAIGFSDRIAPRPPMADRNWADGRLVDIAQWRWTIDWDWRGISIASTRARYRLNAAGQVERIQQRTTGFRVVALVIVLLLFAIGLARLTASEVPPRKAERYQASILVPPTQPRPAATPSAVAQAAPQRAPRRAAVAHHLVPRRHAPRDMAANTTADDAITTAARTGETQSWDEPGGARGFAVAGPAEISGAKTCRAIAILIRQEDGRSQVSNRRRCAD